MKRVEFYVDYCYEAGSSDEYGFNLSGRYSFWLDCPDKIYKELYQVWNNSCDLNSWNTCWEGHDKLYSSINQTATEMLNMILEKNNSDIRDISPLDVLWKLSKETSDVFWNIK